MSQRRNRVYRVNNPASRPIGPPGAKKIFEPPGDIEPFEMVLFCPQQHRFRSKPRLRYHCRECNLFYRAGECDINKPRPQAAVQKPISEKLARKHRPLGKGRLAALAKRYLAERKAREAGPDETN